MKQLYKFYGLYMTGVDSNSIRLQQILQCDSEQLLMAYNLMYSYPLSDQKAILQIIQDAYGENVVNPNEIKNSFIKNFIDISQFIQQNIKIQFKIISYYCHSNKNLIGTDLYDSKYFIPIKHILEQPQKEIKERQNVGLSVNNESISPFNYA